MSQALPLGTISPASREDPRLTPPRKAVYAFGDFTVNTALASLSIVYVTFFLTQVAGLRPELAGMVQLVGRSVDAVTDPVMGRISDRCRWRRGRRRPFFLIGAIPFGVSYALLWADTTGWSQLHMFVYYTVLYVVLSIAMTIVSIPYMALIPEMALGYDARTSLNTYRSVGAVIGLFLAAVGFRPIAALLGGGTTGYAATGALYGVLMALPWLAVHRCSWERPEFQARTPQVSLLDGLRILARHRSFRRLTGLYLGGRISMDLVGTLLIVYFTNVIGRSGDFEITMGLFIGMEVISLPIWLRVAPHYEKATLFIAGSVWWLASLGLLLVAEPSWPRWLLLVFAPLGAVGYALVDLMPWSMLGEVVDEDDATTGERREGLYNGFFMFLRKLGGSIAVSLALVLLGWVGFGKGVQTERVRLAIRLLTSLGPALFLSLSIWMARAYPLTRRAHAGILSVLEARDGSR